MLLKTQNINKLIKCDVFCKVIDNFGDAGFSIRLVKRLHEITGWSIRLVVDDISLVEKLTGKSLIENAEITTLSWNDSALFSHDADITIEIFGSGLPNKYRDRLQFRDSGPLWIDIDYLSAESWIDDYHLRPSPDPRSGKQRYMYFPGFSEGSGGVICENHIFNRLNCGFEKIDRQSWVRKQGIDVHENELLVLLFCYPASPIEALLTGLKTLPQPVCILLAGHQRITTTGMDGRVRIHEIPFLPQNTFDELLEVCDLNFIRGEDSFVRAQWKENPFIWQAYRQNDDHHIVKLNAFLERYLVGLAQQERAILRDLHLGWNGFSPLSQECISSAVKARSSLAAHNRRWARRIVGNGELGNKLVEFILSKL